MEAQANNRAECPSVSVSVVVAAFNCGEYIADCIESLRSQSFSDFECILVDDASSDDTLDRAREAVGDDRRFTLLSLEENGGPGAARNRAIERARGRYLMYVDADDRLTKDALSKLVGRADAQNLDELYFSAQSFYDDDSVFDVLNEDFGGRDSFEGVATGKELFAFFSDRGQYFPQGALRFVRRALLVQNGIRFPEGIIHEDVLFGWEVLISSQRSSFLNEPLYLRRQRAGSIMGAKRRTVENVLGLSVCVKLINAWMHEHKSDLDSAFVQAAGREVGQWCQCIARDWHGLDKAEQGAFLSGLSNDERFEFDYLMLGSGQASERAAAEWRESETYRLGDAVAKIPRQLRIRFRALQTRRKAKKM